MATEKSTKRSNESSGSLSGEDCLDLPIEPDFQSDPPLVSIETMEKNVAFLREEFAAGVPTSEERLRQMVDVEFRL